MPRHLRLVLAILTVHVLVLSSAAAAHTDEVIDAAGDATTTAPPWVDIVGAKVTEQIGNETLYFKFEVAGDVPETPDVPLVAYNWQIDVPGGLVPPLVDYVVVVRWCSVAGAANCGPGPAHWESLLVHNRVGQPALATLDAFPFKIDGPTVKAYVSPALLGDPTGFNWFGVTRLAFAASGIPPVDRAPDTGLTTFTR